MCAVTLLSGSLLQVPDVNASPRHVEVLGDEPAVTVVWFVFATEQAAAIELAGIEFVLDPAFRHQATEGDLVVLPRTLALPVGVKNGLRRRQDGDMDVVDPDDLLKEIRKILLLCKRGELRPVVQPRVNKPADACILEFREELAGALFRESDRENRHAWEASVACSLADMSSLRYCNCHQVVSKKTRSVTACHESAVPLLSGSVTARS